MHGTPLWARLDRLALATAVALLVALGVSVWRDRARPHETPRWESARFVAIAPEGPGGERALWVVAVSLRCPHCQRHLRALADTLATRAHPPRLAALVVDEPARPLRMDLGGGLDGGVWWDSAQVWRASWGRRTYGETFRFDAAGRLVSSTPAGVVPDQPRSRQ